MMTLLLLVLACGDKSEDTALTEPTSEPVDTAVEVEDTAESGDTGSEDTGADTAE